MNVNDVASLAGRVLRYTAMGFAAAVALKVLGVVRVPMSTIDLTCVAIACALAGR